MADTKRSTLEAFVATNIVSFHARRLASLERLKLPKILERKNPYLFRAKGITTAEVFVKTLLDAHLSSQEEGIFGGFLEELALFVCNDVFSGQKSSAEGIDLEFTRDEIRYIVAVKSGPNWGNSSQISKMRDNFKKARRILGTNVKKINIVSVNGCCYGRDEKPDKGDYLKLCGERFWTFISGDEGLYKGIVEPLGYTAKERNEAFDEAYAAVINRFTLEFLTHFCEEGRIDWQRIVALNSAKRIA